MKSIHSIGLRTKLVLTIMLAIAPVLIITLLALGSLSSQLLEAAAREKLEATAASARDAVDRWDHYFVLALENLRGQPDILNMNPDDQKLVLQAMKRVYDGVDIVRVTRPDGVSVARSDGLTPISYADRAWFKACMAGAPIARQILTTKTTGEPALNFSVPIFGPDGKIVGVASVVTGLASMSDLLGLGSLGDDERVFVVDETGIVVAQPHSTASARLENLSDYPPVRAARNGKGGRMTFADDQERVWLADTLLLKNGWTVIAQRAQSAVMAPGVRVMRTAAAIGGGALCIAAILVWLVASRLVRPIRGLTAAALELTRGNWSRRVPEGTTDEVGILSKAFNGMIDRLQSTYREVEGQVEKRTADLSQSEARWRSLVETAPDLILTMDSKGTLLYINRAEHGFTLDALIGTSAYDHVRPESRGKFRECVESVVRTAQPNSVELAVDAPDGHMVWYSAHMGPLREHGQVVGVMSVATDVTRRKQSDISLLESEQRFRSTFEQAAVGMAQVAPDGRFLRVNQTLSKFLGYSSEELLSRTFQDITHPDDLDTDLQHMRQVLDGEIATYSMEKRYYRKDGTIVWVNLTVALVRDASGAPKYFISVIEDICQRKQAEEKLKSEERLLRRLLEIQENERRLVAHDIHDGFVQYAVGAHLQVQGIRGDLDADTIETKVEYVASLLQKAIEEGRRLIRDLRPMVLDESGVVEAIKHLIADEAKHAGFFVAFRHEVQFDRLEPRLEGAIFRIVQEALTNVKHHARTDHAAVEYTQRNGALEVVVRDNGVGFDPSKVSPERFGLRGIRERARLFGGDARIESTPGEGTVIFARLPLQLEI